MDKVVASIKPDQLAAARTERALEVAFECPGWNDLVFARADDEKIAVKFLQAAVRRRIHVPTGSRELVIEWGLDRAVRVGSRTE